MGALRLVFAGGDYDRTRALLDGTIRPEGIDLTYVPLVPEEIFWRMLQYQDFDVSELSMSAYITWTARGLISAFIRMMSTSFSILHRMTYPSSTTCWAGSQPQFKLGPRVTLTVGSKTLLTCVCFTTTSMTTRGYQPIFM